MANAKEYGATGDGLHDDTEAIKAGLAALAKKGGGTLFFPRGRYVVSQELDIPPHIVIKGEARELVSLNWPQFQSPPSALIDGLSNFSIQDISLYASNYVAVIKGGLPESAENENCEAAENITIKNVLIRASTYQGHVTPQQAMQRFIDGTKPPNPNGPSTVRLSGCNLSITDLIFMALEVHFFCTARKGRTSPVTSFI